MSRGRQSTTAALFWTALSGLVVPLSTIVTAPLLARALGPSDRGAVAAVAVPLVVLPILLNFGVGDSLIYHLARGRTSRVTSIRLAVGLGLALGLLTTAVIWVTAPVFLRQFPEHVDLMRMIALTVPLSFVLNALRAVAQGEGNFRLVNVERVLTVLLRLAAVVVAFAVGLLSVASASWISFLAALVAALLFFPLALQGWRRGRGEGKQEEPPVPARQVLPAPIPEEVPLPAGWSVREALLPVTTYGLRTWVGGSVGFLSTKIDQPLLALVSTPQQLGYYAVAAALADVPNAALAALREVIFSTAAGRKAPELAAVATRGLLLISAPAVAVAVLVMPLVVPVMFGSDFAPAVVMAQILLIGAVPASLTAVLGVGLLGIGRPTAWSATIVGGLVLSVGLLLALTPVLGGTGAAVAVTSARTFAFLVLAVIFSRITGVPFRDCVLPGIADVKALVRRIVMLLTGSGGRGAAGSSGSPSETSAATAPTQIQPESVDGEVPSHGREGRQGREEAAEGARASVQGSA